MDKGITLYFGYEGDLKTRLQKIKEAGFTHIITNRDKRFDQQNGTLEEQMELVKEIGLKVSSLHNSYTNEELPYFWKECNRGDIQEKNMIEELYLCKKYGFSSLVIHLFANGKPNEIGLARLKRILAVCEKIDIPIAVENIDDRTTFLFVFEKINHRYLKFCYDSGHNNCFDKGYPYLEKFGDKLVAMHLHDNMGEEDEHTINKFGSINWEEIAKSLSKCTFASLDYEVIMKDQRGLSMEETLHYAYEDGQKLENSILKYTLHN